MNNYTEPQDTMTVKEMSERIEKEIKEISNENNARYTEVMLNGYAIQKLLSPYKDEVKMSLVSSNIAALQDSSRLPRNLVTLSECALKYFRTISHKTNILVYLYNEGDMVDGEDLAGAQYEVFDLYGVKNSYIKDIL